MSTSQTLKMASVQQMEPGSRLRGVVRRYVEQARSKDPSTHVAMEQTFDKLSLQVSDLCDIVRTTVLIC